MLSLADARKAQASNSDTVTGLILLNIGLPDMVFFSTDIAISAMGTRPGQGLAVAQLAFVGPQALIVTGLLSEVHKKDVALEVIPAYVGTSLLGGVTAYSVLALRFNDLRGLNLLAMSQALSADFLFTAGFVYRTVAGRPTPLGLAVTELSMATPALAYSVYKAGADAEWRPMWIGISAWSGAVVLHGLVATAIGVFSDEERGRHDDDASADRPVFSGLANSRRWPFQLKHIGPDILSDGVNSTPGLSISGKF